jgi:micrococcal nuclease
LIFLAIIGAVWISSLREQQKFSPFIPNPRSALVSVVYVIDGDTIEVLIDNKKEKVRLLGIDTAELGDLGKPVECFAQEASLQMKKLVEGKTIRLEDDVSQGDRDAYGRLLRYVYLEDGTDVNKDMITQGFAHEYTFKGQTYRYQKEFQDAEIIARTKKIGLWREGVCTK